MFWLIILTVVVTKQIEMPHLKTTILADCEKQMLRPSLAQLSLARQPACLNPPPSPPTPNMKVMRRIAEMPRTDVKACMVYLIETAKISPRSLTFSFQRALLIKTLETSESAVNYQQACRDKTVFSQR